MLILLYFIFIFLSGYTFASLMGELSLLAKTALAPAMGIFIGAFYIYLLNMLHFPITAPTLMALWFPTGLIIIIIRFREIIKLTSSFIEYFRQETRALKFIIILVALGFIGMTARGSLNPMWSGDAYLHWGPKAIEWIRNAHIQYDPLIEKQLRIWIKYPLYHSIGMMMNVLVLPLPPAYSIKVFDVLHLWGIIFSAAYFLEGLGWNKRHILLGSLITIFAQKDLLGFIISGYAEIEMAYYYFLGATLLISSARPSPTHYICSGFILGLMLITKNEGIIRLFILILCLLASPWRKNITWKNTFQLFIPMIVIKIIDYKNIPVTYFVDWYYENAQFTFEYLISRIPLILETALYALRPLGILKSFWALSFTLMIIFSFYLRKINWPLKKYYHLLLIIFLFNFIFDHIPSWLADKSSDPAALAREVVGRLHTQVSTFLSLAIVIVLHKFTFNFNFNYRTRK